MVDLHVAFKMGLGILRLTYTKCIDHLGLNKRGIIYIYNGRRVVVVWWVHHHSSIIVVSCGMTQQVATKRAKVEMLPH